MTRFAAERQKVRDTSTGTTRRRAEQTLLHASEAGPSTRRACRSVAARRECALHSPNHSVPPLAPAGRAARAHNARRPLSRSRSSASSGRDAPSSVLLVGFPGCGGWSRRLRRGLARCIEPCPTESWHAPHTQRCSTRRLAPVVGVIGRGASFSQNRSTIMVGGKDGHRRGGVSMPEMHQRQQNPWRGLAVGWLKDNVLPGPVSQLLPDFFPIVGAYDNKDTISRNQALNPCQRMLQHRAVANHSAKLVNASSVAEACQKCAHPRTFARAKTIPQRCPVVLSTASMASPTKNAISPTNISHFLQSMAISVT
jgi:hypothetical protein